MNCDNVKVEWNIKIGEMDHTISLIQKETKYKYSLYIDGELLNELKINRWFNYEYQFEIDGKSCSIVKLLNEKEIRLSVEFQYQNKNRKYVPIPKVHSYAKIIIILNYAVLLWNIVYAMLVGSTIPNKIFFMVMCTGCFLFIDSFARYFSNAPFDTKNKLLNIVLRVSLLVLIELIYIFAEIYLIKMFNS